MRPEYGLSADKYFGFYNRPCNVAASYPDEATGERARNWSSGQGSAASDGVVAEGLGRSQVGTVSTFRWLSAALVWLAS